MFQPNATKIGFIPRSAGSLQRGLAFVGALLQQRRRIGNAPLGYVSRDDLAPGLRMAAVERNLIFFRLTNSTVRIERVLHGARNLPTVLAPERNDAARD